MSGHGDRASAYDRFSRLSRCESSPNVRLTRDVSRITTDMDWQNAIIASNEIQKGRLMNRRVEMLLCAEPA